MFEHVLDNVNFNFQINRVLSFGKEGCKREEVLEAMNGVVTIDDWYNAWLKIALIAEKEERYLHSMYYYRMAEFFLLPNHPEKNHMYTKIKAMFSKYYPNVEKEKVPYKQGHLPCIRIKNPNAKQTLIIHGGFDSFIEEFYLLFEKLASLEVNIILFEGAGQGEALKKVCILMKSGNIKLQSSLIIIR